MTIYWRARRNLYWNVELQMKVTRHCNDLVAVAWPLLTTMPHTTYSTRLHPGFYSSENWRQKTYSNAFINKCLAQAPTFIQYSEFFLQTVFSLMSCTVLSHSVVYRHPRVICTYTHPGEAGEHLCPHLEWSTGIVFLRKNVVHAQQNLSVNQANTQQRTSNGNASKLDDSSELKYQCKCSECCLHYIYLRSKNLRLFEVPETDLLSVSRFAHVVYKPLTFHFA